MPAITAQGFMELDGVRYHGSQLLVEVNHLGGGGTHVLMTACAFDSDEKWVEVYVCDSLGHRLVIGGEMQKAKLKVDFDVRDKKTDRIILTVRQ